MPVPFILAGAALASGLTGAVKLFDASKNKATGKKLILQALNYAEYVSRDSRRQGESANLSLDALGRLRLVCCAELMSRYVDVYKNIKNIEYKSPSLKNINVAIESYDVKHIEISAGNAASLLAGGITGMASGAAAGYGAYGLATTIGMASTGTAISTLSGAAATNATLAWLGGGALSAGGMGMAGGTTILGGVVAGPALLVTGLLAAKKSEEFLTKAVQQESEIRIGIEQIKTTIVASNAIRIRACEVFDATKELAEIFIKQLISVEKLVDEKKLTKNKQIEYYNEQVKRRDLEVEKATLIEIDKINKIEARYIKDNNIFTRFWNFVTGKKPKFSEMRKNINVSENFPIILVDGVDSLDFNNFTDDEKNQFQMFTLLGANLHGLIKMPVLDEGGAISKESENAVHSAKQILNAA